MTGEIKACPFCGGMADWAGKETTGYRVACVCCDARGTWGDYGYQALTAWNTRPIEDELAASRDRASDACASVQRERDEAREMLGNGVRLIERAVINTPDQYESWHASAKAFLSRYEGEVK